VVVAAIVVAVVVVAAEAVAAAALGLEAEVSFAPVAQPGLERLVEAAAREHWAAAAHPFERRQLLQVGQVSAVESEAARRMAAHPDCSSRIGSWSRRPPFPKTRPPGGAS